ncbi:MAG: hypothetical protein V4628_16035, partial [Pseudomonadota bacterium]
MNRSLLILLFVSLTTLQGCSPASEESGSGPATPEENIVAQDGVRQAAPQVAEPAVPNAFAIFNTSISVRDIMNSVINPNARQLWGGVSYVESEEGVEETFPQTQEDWDRLKANAIALVEGSNALMLPGRGMNSAGVTPDRPDFQFAPEEIEQLLRDDPENWIINLQAMQDSVLETIDAIDRKDILAFTERG